jgi:hypothetical protein
MRRCGMCLIAAALLFAVPSGARAQRSQGTCTQVRDNATFTGTNLGQANQVMVWEGAEFRCTDGKRLTANQIITNAATDVMSLYGNVRYSDADRTVSSINGEWSRRQGLFQARGDVVVTDAESGSRLSAPSLDYYQVTGNNRVSRMTTMGGRGTMLIRQKTAAAAGRPAKRDSSIVVADIIEIIGDELFRGSGNAVITRTDVRGFGGVVEYDQARGNLLLAMNARIDGDEYDLSADTIRALASEGEQLREVRASRNSRLTSDQVAVESPFLAIFLDSGAVNRMVATRPASSPGQPVSLPRVTSKQFNVSADSIDAVAPRQQLQQVHAIGHAFGERLDTLPPPTAAAALPDILTHDWLRGDTLRATFVENPDSRRDSAGNRERMLQQIVARGAGAPASSALRMRQPNDTTWRIYYTLADRIRVDFNKGEVANTELDGNVRGVFLSPTTGVVADRKRRIGR